MSIQNANSSQKGAHYFFRGKRQEFSGIFRLEQLNRTEILNERKAVRKQWHRNTQCFSYYNEYQSTQLMPADGIWKTTGEEGGKDDFLQLNQNITK